MQLFKWRVILYFFLINKLIKWIRHIQIYMNMNAHIICDLPKKLKYSNTDAKSRLTGRISSKNHLDPYRRRGCKRGSSDWFCQYSTCSRNVHRYHYQSSRSTESHSNLQPVPGKRREVSGFSSSLSGRASWYFLGSGFSWPGEPLQQRPGRWKGKLS